MDLGICGGTIVSEERTYEGNIYIKDGRIVAVTGCDESIPAKKNIDARGKFVFPGGIDPHVHFNDPGFNWRETFKQGTKAAAAGGITTVIDMPLQSEPNLLNRDAYDKKAAAVGPNAYTDYAFWGGFVNDNVHEFSGMRAAGARQFKAFLSGAGSDYPSVHNGVIKKAMEQVAGSDMTLGFHCEDYHIIASEEELRKKAGKQGRADFLDSRPLIAELIATKNVIDLANETGARVHICHVSHPAVAEEIRKAKARGISITAETCPHYLIFTGDDMVKNGTLLKCAPPLRDELAREGLWAYLLDGTLDCIVSDHSPASKEEKLDDGGKKSIWEVWSGISGVQTGFQVLFNEIQNRGLSPSFAAKWMSTGAAKAFGLYPQKGAIMPGADGDIVILDPQKPWEITEEQLLYTNKISGFVGLKGRGVVEATILRGEIIYAQGQVTEHPGYGKLIRL